MRTVTRIDPVSLAKIFGILYAVFGVVYGLMLAGFSALMAASGVSEMAVFAGFGLVGVIASPVLFGISGFLGGLLMGFLYNLVAGWIGGVQVEVDGGDEVLL